MDVAGTILSTQLLTKGSDIMYIDQHHSWEPQESSFLQLSTRKLYLALVVVVEDKNLKKDVIHLFSLRITK